MKRRWVLSLGSVLTALALAISPVGAHAGAATDVVKTKQTALFDLLKQPSPSNQKKVTAVFDEMLDYQALAEASLGSQWGARTDAERAEFSILLKQLVQHAYERNLKKTLNFNINYLGEETSDGAIIVKTKAVSKTDTRAEPIEISYKMVEKDGRWRVQDIVTEDVSLVSSYRSQFTKIIRKNGFPTLLQKMKDKLAKDDA